jgi:hypothetical protein
VHHCASTEDEVDGGGVGVAGGYVLTPQKQVL